MLKIIILTLGLGAVMIPLVAAAAAVSWLAMLLVLFTCCGVTAFAFSRVD
jgi:hypothetical protein